MYADWRRCDARVETRDEGQNPGSALCESDRMNGRLPHAVKQRLTLVIQLRVPMPADDASEAESSAWADLQEAQAILAGRPAGSVNGGRPRMLTTST